MSFGEPGDRDREREREARRQARDRRRARQSPPRSPRVRPERRRSPGRFLALAAAVFIAVAVAVVVAVGSAGSTPGAGTGTTGKGAQNSARTSAGSTPGAGKRRGQRRAGPGGAAGTAGLARGTGVPGTATVPILMYHVINPPPAGAPFPGLYVPAPEFTEQMRALKDAGWHAVTMDQLMANWRRGVPLGPGKPIVISFDNGYDSQFTNAMPILRRLGWVGVENIQLEGLPKSQGGLTDDQVRGLIHAGWELDTQGISHADLITLDGAGLRYQVDTARRILRARFHQPVNWFCYPSGHYDARVVAEVKAAGFVGSTTVVPGWAAPRQDMYRLPRLRVLGGTTGSGLLRQIAEYEHASQPPAAYGRG